MSACAGSTRRRSSPPIAAHGVTHLCGAPIVLNMLVHAPDAVKQRFDHVVEVATGGAAPPSAVIAGDGARWASASPISTA